MTTQQQLSIAKNLSVFNAYDTILFAAELNNVPFEAFLEMMKTLHSIKVKTPSQFNPDNIN